MSKIAIVYATKTKHSKKLAEAIGSALNVKAENIAMQPVLNEIDLLFIVGGIYGGQCLPELLEYVKGLDSTKLKQVALVISCASGKSEQNSVRNLLKEKGIKIIDEFICKGSFLLVSAGHPNNKDLEAASEFAVKTAKSI